jgi:hypothetical protein
VYAFARVFAPSINCDTAATLALLFPARVCVTLGCLILAYVLQWCDSGVAVVLQWCYSGVTVVLQWCYSGVTVVLQACRLADLSIQECDKDVTSILQECYKRRVGLSEKLGACVCVRVSMCDLCTASEHASILLLRVVRGQEGSEENISEMYG